jgi:uracil-DNA glycosylase
MRHSEQFKAYLLWLEERGIHFPVPSPAAPSDNEASAFSGTGIKVLFLADLPCSTLIQSDAPMTEEELALLHRMIVAMQLSDTDYRIEVAFPNMASSYASPGPDLVVAQQAAALDLVDKIKPELIISLGWQATRIALGSDQSWHELRGKIIPSSYLLEIPVLPTLHPRDLLRFPPNKRSTWSDLQRGMNQLGQRTESMFKNSSKK